MLVFGEMCYKYCRYKSLHDHVRAMLEVVRLDRTEGVMITHISLEQRRLNQELG